MKKWSYAVRREGGYYWKLVRFYPMTKEQVKICIEAEHRETKIITWAACLRMQRIRKPTK